MLGYNCADPNSHNVAKTRYTSTPVLLNYFCPQVKFDTYFLNFFIMMLLY